jgi:hypothetical protein
MQASRQASKQAVTHRGFGARVDVDADVGVRVRVDVGVRVLA